MRTDRAGGQDELGSPLKTSIQVQIKRIISRRDCRPFQTTQFVSFHAGVETRNKITVFALRTEINIINHGAAYTFV